MVVLAVVGGRLGRGGGSGLAAGRVADDAARRGLVRVVDRARVGQARRRRARLGRVRFAGRRLPESFVLLQRLECVRLFALLYDRFSKNMISVLALNSCNFRI